MKKDWQDQAREWARDLMKAREGVLDYDECKSLWAQAVVLDRFSCFDLVFTAQTHGKLLDTLPKEQWQDPSKVYATALTALVRKKKLRSYTQNGARWYELNLRWAQRRAKS